MSRSSAVALSPLQNVPPSIECTVGYNDNRAPNRLKRRTNGDINGSILLFTLAMTVKSGECLLLAAHEQLLHFGARLRRGRLAR